MRGSRNDIIAAADREAGVQGGETGSTETNLRGANSRDANWREANSLAASSHRAGIRGARRMSTAPAPVSPDEAVALIRPGARVFVATFAGTPTALLDALVRRGTPDVELVYFLLDGALLARMIEQAPQIRHRPLYVGTPLPRTPAADGVSYVPMSLPQAASFIAAGRLAFDAAIVATSMPDDDGQVSLGPAVGLTPTVLEHTPLVLAELVAAMPRTCGAAGWPASAFRATVVVERGLPEYRHPRDDVRAERIGRYVSRLIEDGATLQCGPGRVPAGALRYLTGRRDLAILTDILTEEMAALVEGDAVTRATVMGDPPVMASFAAGSAELFARLDRNPRYTFWPVEVVSDDARVRARPRMVSITQAFAIDITGQACCDRFGAELFGGLGSQPEFMRAAARAASGKPIICLYATDETGTSNIRATLGANDAVTIPRANVHFVVTEFGIASLAGKSLEERALALIEVADPRHRASLLDEARAQGLIARAYRAFNNDAYGVEDERSVPTPRGAVTLRPARLADVPALQRLFHHCAADEIYLRFFRYLRSLSIEEALRLCTGDHAIDAAFVAVVGDREAERVIGSACLFGEPTTRMAEVGYLVDREWQGMGLGKALQALLIARAKAMRLRGLTAQVLTVNGRMLGLARASGLEVEVDKDGDTAEVRMTW